MEFLSDIELYYSASELISDKYILIRGEEVKHIIKVMRHIPGDALYITNGMGSIYKALIQSFDKEVVVSTPVEEYKYENKFANLTFCIPKLKSSERFEFALEKSTELGITNFIIYESSRTIGKGQRSDRWNKILLSAMKQSLRSHLPIIRDITNIKKIATLPGEKMLFEQKCDNIFKGSEFQRDNHYYLLFGPEGGLSPEELRLFKSANIFKLAENRLRSETAIVKAASLL